MADAEGTFDGTPCPECGSDRTVRYAYAEGFEELECSACGWRSDAEELRELAGYSGDVLQGPGEVPRPPVPKKGLDA